MDSATTHIESPFEAFRLAVKLAGGQIRFGKLVGRTQGAVSKKLAKGEWIWPETALTVEAATGISRHDLRPDIYPIEPASPDGRRDGQLAGMAPPAPAPPAAGSACPAAGAFRSSGEAA